MSESQSNCLDCDVCLQDGLTGDEPERGHVRDSVSERPDVTDEMSKCLRLLVKQRRHIFEVRQYYFRHLALLHPHHF